MVLTAPSTDAPPSLPRGWEPSPMTLAVTKAELAFRGLPGAREANVLLPSSLWLTKNPWPDTGQITAQRRQ